MKLNKYVLALSCAFSLTAYADGHFYVVGSGGVTRSDLDKGKVDKNLSSALDTGITIANSKVDKTDTGYKIQVGYEFTENFAVEGGYTDLGKFTYDANLSDGSKAKATWEPSGWNIDALAIMPLTKDFAFFAKFGFIDAKVEEKDKISTLAGTATDKTSTTDFRTLAGIGLSYTLIDHLLLRVEAESYNNLGNDNKTGEDNVYLFSAGIGYKF
jgi:OOP family OmpA-OmpF porin